MMTAKQIEDWIAEVFSEDSVQVDGDGYHFEATVISPKFEGLSMIKRHRLVYDALGSKMGNEIHALSLKTVTPDEAEDA
jgi:acid stress-induced BolA-like protein IbaG/YrbA